MANELTSCLLCAYKSSTWLEVHVYCSTKKKKNNNKKKKIKKKKKKKSMSKPCHQSISDSFLSFIVLSVGLNLEQSLATKLIVVNLTQYLFSEGEF